MNRVRFLHVLVSLSIRGSDSLWRKGSQILPPAQPGLFLSGKVQKRVNYRFSVRFDSISNGILRGVAEMSLFVLFVKMSKVTELIKRWCQKVTFSRHPLAWMGSLTHFEFRLSLGLSWEGFGEK